MQGFGGGQGDCTAQTSPDHGGAFKAGKVAGAAQRAGKGGQAVADRKAVQQHGGGAHRLVDDGDGPGLGIEGGDGKGDALGVLGGAEDDELAGGGMGGDRRGRNDHAADAGGQCFLVENGCFHGDFCSFHSTDYGTQPLLYWGQ